MIQHVVLDKDSRIPLYVQLAKQIRRKIEDGVFKRGEKLPSKRKIMSALLISKNTVSAAMELLVNEGMVKAFQKSGYFVAEQWDINIPDWQAYIKQAKHKPGNNELRFWADAGGLTDFGLSSDFDIFPFIVEAFNKALTRSYELSCKNDYSVSGYIPLKKSIIKHLALSKIHAETDNILICPGSIQVLYPLYESLMTGGSNFLHEKSNLIVAISDIHSIGMNMIPIEVDQHGLSVDELEKAILKYKHPVLHVDMLDQAPTGIVASKKRKTDIMKLVNNYKLPVVEIEHLQDAWYNKPFPPSLKSMDTFGNVIYLGMFIRSCPFDLQITWIVADKYIINHLSNVLIQDGIKANFFMQIVVDEMFRSGMYYKMMHAIRHFIKKRRETALKLCEKHLKDVGKWNEKNCSFHFWLEFPEVNTKVIFKDNYYKTFHPGYFFDKQDTTHILLCPASIKEEEIEPAIMEIARLVKGK